MISFLWRASLGGSHQHFHRHVIVIASNIPAIAPLIQSSHDLEMGVDPHSHARTVVLAIVLIPETAPLEPELCHW